MANIIFSGNTYVPTAEGNALMVTAVGDASNWTSAGGGITVSTGEIAYELRTNGTITQKRTYVWNTDQSTGVRTYAISNWTTV